MNKAQDNTAKGLLQHAGEVASLSPENFKTILATDVQRLMRELAYRLSELETEAQRLHQSQAELEEARKQSVELFDFAPVGYFNLDSSGAIVNANITGSDMLNVPRAKLLNTPFVTLVEPQHHDAFRSYLKEIADTGHRLSTEIEIRRGDGTIFYAQLQTVALYEKSKIIYRVSVADITERKKIEDALRASEKRYRSFIEVTGELGWTTDAEGEVVEDIPSFRQFTGQSYDEVKGWGWSKALHPDDFEHTVQVWTTAVKQKTNYEVEYRLRRHDGIYRYFLARGVPVFTDDGSIREWVGTCIDITERKQADKILSESEQKYRSLADALPEMVFEADISGTVTYANRRVLASFGLSPDDLSKGLNIFDYILPEQRSIAWGKFKRVLDEGDIGADEYTLIKKDGTAFPSLAHTSRIVREDKVTGIRGIIIDITERKLAEQALAESEKRFRTTLDSMLEACVIIDFNWRYLYVNDAAARLGHRTKEERLGRTMMEVFPGIEKQDTFAHLQRSMKDRVPDLYETEFTFPEGNKVWFEVRAEPVPEGILILYGDITQRKLSEQRLQRGIERLERLHGVTKIIKMQPVGLLMIEHRLIERMVALVAREQYRIERASTLAPERLKQFVDFFRAYTDKTHHGKEEDILFKRLEGKPMAPEHRKVMDELIQEHNTGRKLVGDLANVAEHWRQGDADMLKQAIITASELVKFYTRHIEKEDKQFFLPSMEYFSTEEQDDMLLEFMEFDRGQIHEVYTHTVQVLEGSIQQ